MACCYKSSLGHVSLKVSTLPEGAKLSPCPPIGDVDQDGYVTNSDARAVLNIVAKLDPYKNPTADQLTRANVDTRNNNVTSVDSLMIKRYLGGFETTFRACVQPSPTPRPTPTPTPSPTPPQAKRVFVTSATYNGNLGGLPNADFKCQIRAEEANLGGEWKAWLSDSTTSAASRLNHYDGPYKLINGTIIANNWGDLTDGSLQNPIKITELGTEQGIETWTNTLATSSIPSSSRSCSNWTSSYDDSGSLIQIRGGGLAGGVVGNPNSFSQAWSNSTTASCNSSMSLYCFEQ